MRDKEKNIEKTISKTDCGCGCMGTDHNSILEES
jgi:hypothetical protein